MKFRLPLVAALALLAGACSHHDQTSVDAARTGAGAAATGAMSNAAAVASAKARLAAGYSNRFAAAPDRGALVVYPKAPVVRRDGAYTSYLAAISEAHARDAIGGVLALTSPSGEPLRFRYSRHVDHPDGNWTWVGNAIGDSSREAIITFGQKAVFGSIGQPGKEPLRLTMQGGAAWLVETDPRLIAGIDNAATRPHAPDYFVAPEIAAAGRHAAGDGALSAGASRAGTASATSASGPTVDVLVGYTVGFAAGLGGDSQALTRINFMVDVTNEAYINSQVAANVRLVKAMSVNYADATSNDSALEELTGFKAPSTQTTPNPAFSALRAARDQYGADLVSLVRKFNEPENAGCGIAWLIGGGRSGVDASDEFFGYSVVSDGRDAGTDGKTYYCRDETFAHELGHNMGSQHDRDTADGDDNILQSNEYGAYTFSFGYKTDASNGNFYTIMAYGDTGQTRYRVFSNPNITFCGGVPCGIPDQADNARSLNLTVGTVATFRATVVPAPVPTPVVTGVRGDANADGRSDMIWHNPVLQQFQPWYMNGATWTYGNPSAIPSKYRIGAVGDFNGDGRADVLWYDTAKTELWAWIANADGTYAVNYLRNYPTGWEPVGVGDANADGRADIFWQSPTAQGMQVWLMNGASWTYGPNNGVGSQYRIVSIGDYNGDGLSDVLWRNTANTELWQWQAQAGGGYSVLFMRDYPQGWSIVATGDINGDGRADVFWHNPTQQATQSWYMQGATWSYGPVNAIPSQYRVSTAGDFNGDGRMDVLWTDNATLWTWQGNGDGTFGINFLRDYPTGWFLWNYGGINYNGGVYNGT